MNLVILLTLAVASDPGVVIAGQIQAANEQARQPVKKPPVNPAEWRTAKVPTEDKPIQVGPDAKPDARPLVGAYAAIYERVEKGATVFLSVGQDAAGFERCDDVPSSIRPGLYRCYPGPYGPAIEPAVVVRPPAFPPILRTLIPGGS